MKFLHISKLLCLFVLLNQVIFADGYDRKTSGVLSTTKNHDKKTKLAISGFSKELGSSYIVYIPADTTNPVPISLNRNFGTKKQFAVLKKNGMQILESGNYQVKFSIGLENNESPNDLLLKISVKRSSDQNNQLSGVVKVKMNSSATLEVSGLLKNVKQGELISLSAVSEIHPAAIIQVSDWKLSISKDN